MRERAAFSVRDAFIPVESCDCYVGSAFRRLHEPFQSVRTSYQQAAVLFENARSVSSSQILFSRSAPLISERLLIDQTESFKIFPEARFYFQ